MSSTGIPNRWPGRRPSARAVVIAAAAGAAAVLLAFVGWRLLTPEPAPASTLAPAERVEDTAAGIAYALPSGWEELASYDRWDRYSSGADAGLVGPAVFGFDRPLSDQEDLGSLAESLAESESLFLREELTDFKVFRSEAVEIDGREAHEVELTAVDPVHGPVYARLALVAMDDGRAGVLFGFTDERFEQDRDGISEAFEGLEPL